MASVETIFAPDASSVEQLQQMQAELADLFTLQSDGDTLIRLEPCFADRELLVRQLEQVPLRPQIVAELRRVSALYGRIADAVEHGE